MGERKPRRPRDIAEHLASLTVLKERMGETADVPCGRAKTSALCARSRRSHVTSHAVPQISPYPLEPSSRLLQSRPDSRRSCPLKARATENRTRALNDRAILATQQNSAENVPRTTRVAELSLVLRCLLA